LTGKLTQSFEVLTQSFEVLAQSSSDLYYALRQGNTLRLPGRWYNSSRLRVLKHLVTIINQSFLYLGLPKMPDGIKAITRCSFRSSQFFSTVLLFFLHYP